MKVTFFKSGKMFRKWLEKRHASVDELWVGYYKKASGVPSITWPESVDEALCFGWIDGLRKSIDEKRYKIRFTPRRKGSHWSAINIEKVSILIETGKIREEGLLAFANKDEKRSRRAPYEQKSVKLPPEFQVIFKANKAAWTYFRSMAPSYQKMCSWWVISAKQEATKKRRLNVLIESSEDGSLIELLKWNKKNLAFDL